MSPGGASARVLIVLAWLVLVGWQMAGALGGGGTAADPAGIIAAQLDRTLDYQLSWGPAGGSPQRLGRLSLSTQHDDAGFRLTTIVTVDRLDPLPGAALLALASAPSGGGVDVTIEQRLDARLRLSTLSATGKVLGRPVVAAGGFAADGGFVLRWSFNGLPEQATPLPGLKPDRIATSALGGGLPPGLKPGQVFTLDVLGPDPAAGGLGRQVVQGTVVAWEPVETARGLERGLRVELRQGGRQLGTAWCDAHGTTLVQEQAGGGLRMRIERVRGPAGDEAPLLWSVGAGEAGP